MAFTYSFLGTAGVKGLVGTMKLIPSGYGPYADFPTPATYTDVNNPGNVGMLAYATDKKLLYQSTGSAWQVVGIASPGSEEQGDILYYNGTIWTLLHHGTLGQLLVSQGHGANPAWGTYCSVGAYSGDDSANKAIAHGLGVTPSWVQIYQVSGGEWYHLGNSGDSTGVYYMAPGGAGRIGSITIRDATNFYVGNASSYANSANASGSAYRWIAFV